MESSALLSVKGIPIPARQITCFECYKGEDRSKRRESKKIERWKSFKYDELVAHDKTNLDIFWLQDDSLEDIENLQLQKSLPEKSSNS